MRDYRACRAQATGSGADDERVAGRGGLPDHSITPVFSSLSFAATCRHFSMVFAQRAGNTL